MRVLHLYNYLSWGGAEMRLLDVLGEPACRELEHHVALLNPRPGPLDDAFFDAGVAVHPCRLGAGFPARFGSLIRRLRPDVVHANQQWMSGPLLALAHGFGVRGRVCQFHASNDIVADSAGRRLRNRVLRRVVRREATAISGVSASTLDALWPPDWRGDRRFSVVYLGVDTGRFQQPRDRVGVRAELGLPADARLALHVANMGPAKNHPGLGELFGVLARRHPDLHLVAVGRPNPTWEAPMRAAVAAAGASERLHVLGPRSDVPRWMLGADLLLLPSVNEGLPTVVIEARAAGLPAVVTDLPGCLELATHLDRVTTVPLGGGWDRWAAACDDALAAGTDAHLGDANPIRGTVFDARVSARAHAQLWSTSVARR